MNPEFTNNVISVGVSLESQLIALLDFLKKKKKTNTIILFPENKFTDFIEKKLAKLNLDNTKIFKYDPNPEVLTGEIEKLTNYSQRKRNLELRKKFLKTKKTNNLSKNWKNLNNFIHLEMLILTL